METRLSRYAAYQWPFSFLLDALRSATRGICLETETTDAKGEPPVDSLILGLIMPDPIGIGPRSPPSTCGWTGVHRRLEADRRRQRSAARSVTTHLMPMMSRTPERALTIASVFRGVHGPVREVCAFFCHSPPNSVLTASTGPVEPAACGLDDRLLLRKTECMVAFGKKRPLPLLHQHDDR
ncbi:hypothetical protein EI94DRAFT_477841 [Lactarius quietus]|nr:hypothetical protein EI94DRAFT_477841 [Lactarius quietus]